MFAALAAGTSLLLLGARSWFAPGDLGATDPRRGREVFWGRGACSGCHSLNGEGGSVRGPAFGHDLVDRAGTRVPGLDAAAYLVQSLYQPGAVVVAGYPMGLMPAVDLPPLALDEDDAVAVLVYLWTVTRPQEAPPVEALRRAQRRLVEGSVDPIGAAAAVGDAARGRSAYHRLGCRACHRLAIAQDGVSGDVLGPDLDGIGRYQSARYLAESVVDPSAVVIPGPYTAEDGHTSRMPTYAPVLASGELEDLVAFLQSSR